MAGEEGLRTFILSSFEKRRLRCKLRALLQLFEEGNWKGRC